MMFPKRCLATFLFVMSGLALIDWMLAIALLDGFPPIFRFVIEGGMHDGRVVPPFFVLALFSWPGNGYSVLCRPFAWSLLSAGGMAVVACLAVNRTRMLSFAEAPHPAGVSRWRVPAKLYFVASVALVFGYSYSWFQYIQDPFYLLVLTSMNRLVGPFIPLLFVLMCVATGQYLWRTRKGD